MILKRFLKKIEIGLAMKYYTDLFMIGAIARQDFLCKIDELEARLK